MLIRTIRKSDVPEREVTDPALYLRRREFLAAAGAIAAAPLLPACGPGSDSGQAQAAPSAPLDPLAAERNAAYSTDEAVNDRKDATRYNNFYEFGTDKTDPSENAHTLVTRPWSVEVGGECAKPGTLGIDELLAPANLEERVYRLRCVEAWSMVIPWIGVPLGKVLARFEPTSKAKYVAFETLLDPEHMPGQKRRVLEWPYREGLRIDEAMHPLTLLTVGMYGTVLPNQNGAPVRLIVPWKYGFKSIKSIVKVRFTETQPNTSWNDSAPREYGFYSNVNPEVDHPRWSQKRERRIGELRKRPTLMLNGYAEEVGELYAGMDLRKLF